MALSWLGKVVRETESFRNCTRCLLLNIQKKRLSSSKILYRKDDPIKYSATKASKMTTYEIFGERENPAVLPIERYVILGSIMVFLIYLVVRKENKIDRILDGSFAYEEEDEIKVLNALLHAKLKGLKTDELEKKLKMIRSQK